MLSCAEYGNLNTIEVIIIVQFISATDFSFILQTLIVY